MEQVYWLYFSSSTCSLQVSGSHSGNSHNISNSFVMIIIVTMNNNQRSLMLLKQLFCGTTNQTTEDGNSVCSDCFRNHWLPSLSPCLPGLPVSQRHTIFKLVQLTSLHLTVSKCHSEESQVSYFKWKLEMTKLSEEGMTQVKTGHKLGLLYQWAKLQGQSRRILQVLLQWIKFSKPGFNGTRTMNFQMFKLDLEKAEEPEITLPTSTGSQKKQTEFQKKSTSELLITPKTLTV